MQGLYLVRLAGSEDRAHRMLFTADMGFKNALVGGLKLNSKKRSENRTLGCTSSAKAGALAGILHEKGFAVEHDR